jgi:hypothetical protein
LQQNHVGGKPAEQQAARYHLRSQSAGYGQGPVLTRPRVVNEIAGSLFTQPDMDLDNTDDFVYQVQNAKKNTISQE